jgi:prepilin-type N-terminal cleavage/methylation domain-containing protein
MMMISKRSTGRKCRTNGFTLIELMVVVIIVGVLAAVAVPLYTSTIKDARTAEATTRLGAIMTAAKTFYQKNGHWPSSPDEPGFFGDFTSTEHFSFQITRGGGTKKFTLQAKGLKADDMKKVRVNMTCNNIDAKVVIQVKNI